MIHDVVPDLIEVISYVKLLIKYNLLVHRKEGTKNIPQFMNLTI